jgi:hypothetical protein
MEWVDVAILTVRREFRHGTYEYSDGTKAPCLELTRDCGLGCTCGAVITKATPGPELAEAKCLCFNDRKKQGVSEVKGTAKPIKEGPDEWIYEVQAKLFEARQSHDYPACALFRGGKCTCDADETPNADGLKPGLYDDLPSDSYF